MRFQIKTQQVLGEFLKILPRAAGKATFVPHLFHTLMRRMTTRVPALTCYCTTQSNRFWSQLAGRAAPGSRFRLRPAAFVFGVGGCLLVGRVFVLMQQKKSRGRVCIGGYL